MKTDAKSTIETGKAILGIEFGSTRIKAVLIDPENHPIAQGSHTWENQLVDGLWTYSIEEIWYGLQDCYANDVECIEPKPLPKLPVASALWKPMPNFEIGAGAWILAGGTHHSCFSYDLTAEYWEDYAEISGIEMVHINKDTTISEFKKELRMNEVYYMLNKALC